MPLGALRDALVTLAPVLADAAPASAPQESLFRAGAATAITISWTWMIAWLALGVAVLAMRGRHPGPVRAMVLALLLPALTGLAQAHVWGTGTSLGFSLQVSAFLVAAVIVAARPRMAVLAAPRSALFMVLAFLGPDLVSHFTGWLAGTAS